MTQTSTSSTSSPFYVKDCALAPIATGVKAQTLAEFRDKLATMHLGCIFYHFWAGRLRSSLEHRDYHHDFSRWAHYSLHDEILAERFELLNPLEYDNDESLREEIIELVDQRLDEEEFFIQVKKSEQFHFIHSRIIVFNTSYVIKDPSDMINILPLISRSAIFYHFIDAIRRTPNKENDFTTWLRGFNRYDDLIKKINLIDPFFITLEDVRDKLVALVTQQFREKK